mgnify:CR=1 FL=1
MVGLKVVLANGTLLEVSPKINRHLWRAMGVSVGRLGIITGGPRHCCPSPHLTVLNRCTVD